MTCGKCQGFVLEDSQDVRCINCGWRGWTRHPTEADVAGPGEKWAFEALHRRKQQREGKYAS